jgi:hypothetical protein
MADNGVKVHIEGKAYDLEDFELGDLEWLEEYLDAPLGDNNAMNSMKAAVGFVYIIKRRDDPGFTIEQARKVKLAAIDAPDDDEEPQPAASKRPTKGARSK